MHIFRRLLDPLESLMILEEGPPIRDIRSYPRAQLKLE